MEYELGQLATRIDDLQRSYDGLVEESSKHSSQIARIIAALRVHITKHRDSEATSSEKKKDKQYYWSFLAPLIGGVSGGGVGWALGHFVR